MPLPQPANGVARQPERHCHSSSSSPESSPYSRVLELKFAVSAAGDYFNMRKLSIFGGSNEIQRNIIAQMLLGL